MHTNDHTCNMKKQGEDGSILEGFTLYSKKLTKISKCLGRTHQNAQESEPEPKSIWRCSPMNAPRYSGKEVIKSCAENFPLDLVTSQGLKIFLVCKQKTNPRRSILTTTLKKRHNLVSREGFWRNDMFKKLDKFSRKKWGRRVIFLFPHQFVISCNKSNKSTHQTSSAMSSKSKSSRIFNVEKALATWASRDRITTEICLLMNWKIYKWNIKRMHLSMYNASIWHSDIYLAT